MVVPFAHVFRVRAHQYIDDVIEAEAEPVFFADSIDARQKFLRGERAVECFTRRQTIVAPAAILLRPFLAEITQQRDAPALRRLGIMHHLLQLRARDLLLLCARLFDDELRLLDHVARAEQQHAIAR